MKRFLTSGLGMLLLAAGLLHALRAHTIPRTAAVFWPWEGAQASRTARFTFIQ